MALFARDNRITRRSWLLAGLGIPLSAQLFGARSDELAVSFDGDNLHVGTPGLHFLTGGPLTRLKNADTVVFLSQLTLFSDDRGTEFHRPIVERLIVSYDIWTEKFKVTIRGVSTRSTPYLLTADQAEAWCIDNLAVSALGLAPDRPFWMRFDLRAASPKDFSTLLGDSGISFGGLIEMLSRKGGADEPHWKRDAGPLRLLDLPRTPGRGTRGG